MVEVTLVKITVLKRLYNQELAEQYRRPDVHKGPCPCSEGEEYLVNQVGDLPEGLCPWAWDDMHKFVLALMAGTDFKGMKQPNTFLASCTDGIKPVVFKLERIDG